MALQQSLFVNGYQKGSQENANIGFGSFVGVETYTQKGVAKLTKDTTKRSGSVVLGKIISFANQSNIILAQDNGGRVYKSIDTGDTWTNITGSLPLNGGGGVIIFENYAFAFDGGDIYYNPSPYNAGGWVNWKTITNAGDAVPMLFPNDGFIYFANVHQVGKFGFGTASSFNPAGIAGTDYSFTTNQLTLPSQYTVNCMSFLPTNYIALGTGSFSDSQICDIILWNPTLSTYETPLRLYGTGAQGQTGVRQIINRNNILYATTGGNMCLFSTNGTQFQQVEDFSLRTSWRTSGGAQASFPIFLNPNAKAIAVLGNKLLIGSSTGSPNAGVGSPFGRFPMGVWTVSFTDGGSSSESSGVSMATQLEFPISTGTIRTSGFNDFSIGAILSVNNNQALIGWQDNSSFGIDKIDLDTYQTDITNVIIESSLLEVGSPLEPTKVRNIQVYLVNDLQVGQTLRVYGRIQLNQDYTLLQTFDPTTDGIQNSYSVVANPLEPGQYLQIKVQMSTGSPVTQYTPLLRNVQIS